MNFYFHEHAVLLQIRDTSNTKETCNEWDYDKFFSRPSRVIVLMLSTTQHSICNWNAFAKRENTFHTAFWRQRRGRRGFKKSPHDFEWSSRRLQLKNSCLWLTDYDGWPPRLSLKSDWAAPWASLARVQKKSCFKWSVINTLPSYVSEIHIASCKHSIFEVTRLIHAFIIPTLVIIVGLCGACNLQTVDGCLHAC